MSGSSNITNEGEQFIPATQRPDGTWRKARRIKDGYIPQEEVPLYESKGKQFMNKRQEPVVLSTGKVAQRPIPGLCIVKDEKEKPRKNKNKIKEVNEHLDRMKITPNVDEEPIDPIKKLKNLRKRLREIECLQEKLKNGVVTKLEPEQLTKLKRKNELMMQIRELEESNCKQ